MIHRLPLTPPHKKPKNKGVYTTPPQNQNQRGIYNSATKPKNQKLSKTISAPATHSSYTQTCPPTRPTPSQNIESP